MRQSAGQNIEGLIKGIVMYGSISKQHARNTCTQQ
jgi:hypothetical protein